MRFRYSREIIASLLLLNLIAAVSSNSKCATLYNSRSYQGTPFSLQDGSKHPSLQYMSFVSNSIRVTTGCALTIFDSYGTKQTIDRDVDNLGWAQYRKLDASCCECGGCSAAATQLGSLCARLYENARCDGCSGFRLDMKSGDGAKNFGPLNNRMTAVAVRPGCTLTVFLSVGYEGWRFNFTESNNMMGNNWYKQVSSAMCGRNDAGPGPNTYFTTRQPITLPTVQTRPPMTLPTVPTNRPIYYTYPTVPTTTRAPMTLPTVPTTTRAPITLPTVPTTTVDDWLGEASSEELVTTPSTTTTKRSVTLPTVPPASESTELWPESDEDGFGSSEYGGNDGKDRSEEKASFAKPAPETSSSVDLDWPEGSTEDVSGGSFGGGSTDEDDGWGSESEEESTTAKVIITTTKTTPKPTTTTTTTEASYEPDEDEDAEEDEEEGDDWW